MWRSATYMETLTCTLIDTPHEQVSTNPSQQPSAVTRGTSVPAVRKHAHATNLESGEEKGSVEQVHKALASLALYYPRGPSGLFIVPGKTLTDLIAHLTPAGQVRGGAGCGNVGRSVRESTPLYNVPMYLQAR
jgi:hypothetical protein